MTTNRPTPEGAWDHEDLYLEDKASFSTDDELAMPRPSQDMGLLYNSEKDVKMLKGWRTVAVATAIAAVGALQTAGWADLVPAPYVGPIIMALGFGMAFLRGITDTKVGEK